MKTLGYGAICTGFLAASWFAVLHPTEVGWTRFLLALLVSVAGVALARYAALGEARAGEKLTGDVHTLETSIDRVVERITDLEAGKAQIHPCDVHGRIDELFPDDLTAFAEARQSIAHVHGLQAYAAVMNHFAAGERYLNRVWSASVDGYIDEVHEYLGRARDQFVATRDTLKGLGGRRA